jgi:hypothetical protein
LLRVRALAQEEQKFKAQGGRFIVYIPSVEILDY